MEFPWIFRTRTPSVDGVKLFMVLRWKILGMNGVKDGESGVVKGMIDPE